MNSSEYENIVTNEYNSINEKEVENKADSELVENTDSELNTNENNTEKESTLYSGSNKSYTGFYKKNNNPFDIACIILYLILVASVFFKFVPIIDGNWFSIGMGKLVLLSSLCGIAAIIRKNYFAAFFISLFSLFFVFHEIIIFYDDYAIKLGKELNPGGVFRSVIELYRDAFSAKCGAFWSMIGSGLSMILICVAWIGNVVIENLRFGKKEINTNVVA